MPLFIGTLNNGKQCYMVYFTFYCIHFIGDMLSAGGRVAEAVRCRVRCDWGKFNELMLILTMRGTSLKVKGKINKAFVQSVMMYGSETWAMKVEDTQKLKRTEVSMMRRMCGVSLKKHLSNETLRGKTGY